MSEQEKPGPFKGLTLRADGSVLDADVASAAAREKSDAQKKAATFRSSQIQMLAQRHANEGNRLRRALRDRDMDAVAMCDQERASIRKQASGARILLEFESACSALQQRYAEEVNAPL